MGARMPHKRKKRSNASNTFKIDKKMLAGLEKEPPPESLLLAASIALQSGNPEAAAGFSESVYGASPSGSPEELRALGILVTALLEQGEHDEARSDLLELIELDPDGVSDVPFGGGADKFLWLAQLSEEGGADSVSWFVKGADVLRRKLARLTTLLGAQEQGSEAEADEDEVDTATLIAESKKKLAGALCGIAEVYMTDLSWEFDAEARCEAALSEAMMVADYLPDVWQTVANVRVSQERTEEARKALKRSLALWQRDKKSRARNGQVGGDGNNDNRDDDNDDNVMNSGVPEFATRISLARLLLEVDMRAEAIEVLEGLVEDNDESVEAWYLGGWGLYLEGKQMMHEGEKGELDGSMAGANKATGVANKKERGDITMASDGPGNGGTGNNADDKDGTDWRATWMSARRWLYRCLKFYFLQEYEDERMGEHAGELLTEIKEILGDDGKVEEDEWSDKGEDEEDEEDDDNDSNNSDNGGWEDVSGNEDEDDGDDDVEMTG